VPKITKNALKLFILKVQGHWCWHS